jgi:hypothetical protein
VQVIQGGIFHLWIIKFVVSATKDNKILVEDGRTVGKARAGRFSRCLSEFFYNKFDRCCFFVFAFLNYSFIGCDIKIDEE